MKKILMIAVASMALLVGCNEKADASEKSSAEVKAPVETSAPVAQTQPQKVEFKSIEWSNAIEMAKNGAVYVDVRNPDELAQGFVPTAINIPLGDLRARYTELPKDKDLLVYCRSGRRSEAASNFLVNNGYDRVFNVLGGYLAYPNK